MKSWLRHASVLAMTLMCTAALAQAGASKNAPAPGSTEAQVAARFAEKAGGTKPDQVFKGPGGLYEVLIGGERYYVDAGVNFIIAGTMFDPRTRENLKQKRLETALKVDLKSLPMDRAIKTTRGNGSRVLVTFEDPNCPYCKKLWQNMAEMKDVTIYTFLYPILSAESHEKSKAIWCSKDRAAAWDQYMVGGKSPAGAPDGDAIIARSSVKRTVAARRIVPPWLDAPIIAEPEAPSGGTASTPTKFIDLTPDTLRADYKVDYVLMVAEAYRLEQDQSLAARRLAIFGSEAPSVIAANGLELARQSGFADSDIALIQVLVAALQTWQPSSGGAP